MWREIIGYWKVNCREGRSIKMVEWEDMRLTFPHTNIKNASIFGKILSKNHLEPGRRTRAQPSLYERYTCNWVGREEKWSGQDLCPWEGTQRKRENAKMETQLEDWPVRATDCVPQSRGPMHRRQATLAGWKTKGTNRRASGKPGLCSWGACACVCTLACPLSRAERGLLWWLLSFPQLPRCFPAQAKKTLQPHSLHIIVQHWIWGSLNRGEDSTMGYRGDQVSGQNLGGTAVAIIGAYSSSASEAA